MSSGVIRHSLVTVAAGSHPLYPPVQVTLERAEPYLGDQRVEVTLRHAGRQLVWAPTAALLEDPPRLSDGLEAMLRTLCPPGQGG